MTAPVYIQASGSDKLETCLLGTNVVFPLGLMQPAAEDCHKEDGHASTGSVCLFEPSEFQRGWEPTLTQKWSVNSTETSHCSLS